MNNTNEGAAEGEFSNEHDEVNQGEKFFLRLGMISKYDRLNRHIQYRCAYSNCV